MRTIAAVCCHAMETAAWFLVWGLSPLIFAKKRRNIQGRRTMVHVFGVDREIDIPADKFPTESELTQLEQPMPNIQHGWYDSVSDNAKLHYRKFIPSSSSSKPLKAVIVYQHGISTHGGKAFVLPNGRKLNTSLLMDVAEKQGYALYLPDMYGHGYSEGTRFLIPKTWKNNLQDLFNFINNIVVKEQPSLPLFIMGESYGGTLVIHAARTYQDDPSTQPTTFRAILLTGPAIVADLPPYPVYAILRYVLAPNFPKWRPFFMPNPVSPERIWRDPEVLALRTEKRYVEMGIDGSGIPFRLGTALQMVLALELVHKTAIHGFHQPFCNIHGVLDAGVPVTGSDDMDKYATTPTEHRAYHRMDGAYHDLLSDTVAEQVMEYFVQYINKQVQLQK